MTKNYFFGKSLAFSVFLMLGMLFAVPSGLVAQQLLNENFNYPMGNLYGEGEWMKYGSNPEVPIQVVASPLTYAGYQDQAIGNAIELKDGASGEDLQKKFTIGDAHITTGKVYFSALIKMKSASPEAGKVYFMNLVNRNSTGNVSDGKATNEYGKLFAFSTSEGKYQLGVSRSSSNPVMYTTDLELDKTYLVVVKYEIIAGNTNDEVSLFVNPADLQKEPAPVAKYTSGSDGDVSATWGFQSIECRQGGSASKSAPNVLIDALRVAVTYSELFGGEAPEPEPTITLSGKSLVWGNVYIGETYTKTINVKGANLKGDVLVSGFASGEITASVTTLLKTDVESAKGVDVTFTFRPQDPEKYMDNVFFDSEGAAQIKVSSIWNPATLIEVADLKTLSSKKKDDGACRYAGEAIITCVYKEGSKTTYYLQDATGAMPIYDGFGDVKTQYAIGDKITGFKGTVEPVAGLNSVIPIGETLGTVVSTGNVVEPVTVTLTALATTPGNYAGRLIKIENVTFKEVVADAVFDESEVSPAITDGTADGRMKLFKGTTITGSPIPVETVTLIGIATSSAGAVIAPRNLNDIVKQTTGEPSLEILPTTVGTVTGHLNVTTEMVKLTIKANNLPGKVLLDVTGANRTMFSVSKQEIPAGTSTTEVIVFYTPTLIGKHSGRLNFESVGAPEFNQAINLNGVGIDPANPPTVTINPTSLPDFSAKVGEKQEQTIVVTTAKLPDFLNVKVMGEGQGAFLLSSTTFLKDGTSNLKITFTPKKAGEFMERIEFKALEVETFYMVIKGTATEGGEVDVPEGDKFPLSTANPQKLINESFDGAVKNKPLSILEWKNVASVGTRAWWGYDLIENEIVVNKVAKVTAYDSKVVSGKETPCEMMLVTPALDFKNSDSKMFTFRVMGNLLRDNQTDMLELCYIDMEDGDMYVSPVGGFEMPYLTDQNEEWMEFHLNLEQSNLADVFFMGFRFKSTRGTANSATYYIDNVSYGRTNLPSLIPSVTQLAFEVPAGTDYVSNPIQVTGLNTTAPITVSVGGANKSKFEISEKQLPASGGSFTVSFNSTLVGVHEAYVKLASIGAADVYIPLTVNSLDPSGIEAIPFNETPDVTVFDVTGRVMLQKDACKAIDELTNQLTSGTYVVRASSASGVKTVKIVIP